MSASTLKNFAWNLILTVSNYIFPFITYPYVSRVLGVENIGICNYVDSIVDYFVLFSMLGVGSLGVREIAKVKGNKVKLQSVFSSLVAVLLVLTILSVILLLFLTFTIDHFHPYRPFLLIGILKIVFSALSLAWLFQGLSEFRYITVLTLVIRILYVITVFIFVHSKEHVFIYYLLTCLTIVFSSIVNWKYLNHFVRFNIKSVHPRKYLASIFNYGLYLILVSMYTSFNVFFLGSITDDTQVGYFSTATKLYGILMSVFTAFTTVMIPHVSELVGKKEFAHLNHIAIQTFELIFAFSFPIIIGSFVYANVIIDIIAGKGYEGAVLPFRIVMILLLIIAINQIVIQQFLMAVKKSKCIVIISIAGALVGVVLNVILTPSIMSTGSAISWTVSEFCVFITALYYFKKYFKMNFPLHVFFRYFSFSVPYIIICMIFYSSDISWQFFAGFLLCFVWFYISNIYILRNKSMVAILNSIKSRIGIRIFK